MCVKGVKDGYFPSISFYLHTFKKCLNFVSLCVSIQMVIQRNLDGCFRALSTFLSFIIFIDSGNIIRSCFKNAAHFMLAIVLKGTQWYIFSCSSAFLVADFKMFVINSRLIFSAGYYSAPIFFFFTSSNKKIFRFTSFCRFFNILRDIFLTSLD